MDPMRGGRLSSRSTDAAGRRTQHARLAEELRAAIIDGTHPVGSRLPTESMLCEQYGLSRGTVRVALGTLEDLGLISRRPGAGTVVVSRDPVDSYLPFVTIRDELVAIYRNTGVRAPVTRTVVVDAALARHTGLPEDSEWRLIEGARRHRRHPTSLPLCWTQHYVEAGAPPHDIERAVDNSAAVQSHRIEQTVRAVPMPTDFADQLEALAGSPALEIGRRHLDVDGRLVSASFHTHPGDRFTLRNLLAPGG